jgi:Subtilase family
MVMNNPSPGYDTPPFEWSATPTGSFSGIVYSTEGKANGLDPYFVWADISGFAHLRKPGQLPDDMSHVPQLLPVLVALQPNVTASALLSVLTQLGVESSIVQSPAQTSEVPILTILPAYYSDLFNSPGGVIPATLNRAFFKRRIDKALSTLVRRIELDLPQEATLNLKPLQEDHKPIKRKLLKGKVLAFIDDGCAFAHPHFVRKVGGTFKTRVQRLWDMNVRGPLSTVGPPASFTAESYPGEYGRDFTDVQLNQFMADRNYGGRVDEDAVYADFARGTLDNVNRLQHRAAHGTHVMDMACGPYFVDDSMCSRTNAEPANPTWTNAQDYPTSGGGQDASDAQIIFVQLPMRTVQDTSGRNTMTKDVIAALTYILSQCEATAQIVLNLSWGALAGSHDGTHVLEQYMDALIAWERLQHPMPLPKNRLQIVVPAGNGYQSRTHANFLLKPGDNKTLQWRAEPDDVTESFLELWMSTGSNVNLVITTPSGNVLPVVRQNGLNILLSSAALPGPILAVNYPLIGNSALVALAPTSNPEATRATAEHGLWKVKVSNAGSSDVVVDGYVERDDVALNTRRGARQSYFDDPHYDRAATEDDVQTDLESHPELTYVRREGVFNNISTGNLTEKVGGVRQTDMEVSEYSPQTPLSANPNHPPRPGVVLSVPHYATSEESPTLHGVRAAGTRSAGTVRLSGTSMAAPQIARDLFNALP